MSFASMASIAPATAPAPIAIFAPITEAFDTRFARSLPPAAKTLWTWLRRKAPPGREIEFCLQDFADTFQYTLKWARSMLNVLVEHGLVEIVRRYYNQGFKIRVLQPGEVGKKTSIDGDKTSQKQPSNPDSVVPNNRENIQENKNKTELFPPTHPVLKDREVGLPEAKIPLTDEIFQPEISRLESLSPPEIPKPKQPEGSPLKAPEVESREILQKENYQTPEHQDLLQKAQAAGIHLNRNLITLVINSSVAIVQNALAALQEQLDKGKNIKNREGFFCNAIRRGWKPNRDPQEPRRSPAATEVDPDRRARVAIDYERLGYDPDPIEALPVARSPVQDLSDTFTLIQVSIRRLGWDKARVEAVLQQRYNKPKQRLLSDGELRDWADFLVAQVQ